MSVNIVLQNGKGIDGDALVGRVILLDEVSTSEIVEIIARIYVSVDPTWSEMKNVKSLSLKTRLMGLRSDLLRMLALACTHSVPVQAPAWLSATLKKLKAQIEKTLSSMAGERLEDLSERCVIKNKLFERNRATELTRCVN